MRAIVQVFGGNVQLIGREDGGGGVLVVGDSRIFCIDGNSDYIDQDIGRLLLRL
jgi:hypothetical protein